MTNMVMTINNTELPIREYAGRRVVTFSDIDKVHNRHEGTARKRFNDNKEHFKSSEDYYKVKCDEVRPFFGQTPPNGFNPKGDIILITETGYLMLAKSFTDDLAWEVQRQLVNGYFRTRDTASFREDKITKVFPWKNRTKSVLDTGYNLARQHFVALDSSTMKVIA